MFFQHSTYLTTLLPMTMMPMSILKKTIEKDQKIDYTINHVFRSLTVQELINTLLTICELGRNQLLTILAMSVQNPQLTEFLLTGNGGTFLYIEESTAWLYDCPHFVSPLYKADRCFDRTHIHYKGTLILMLNIKIVYSSSRTNKTKFSAYVYSNSNQNYTAQKDSQLKMLVYFQMENLMNFGTKSFFQNILIQ